MGVNVTPFWARKGNTVINSHGNRREGGRFGLPVLGAVLCDVSVKLERLYGFHQGVHLLTTEQGKVIPLAEHLGTIISPDPKFTQVGMQQHRSARQTQPPRAFFTQHTSTAHNTQCTTHIASNTQCRTQKHKICTWYYQKLKYTPAVRSKISSNLIFASWII